MHFGLAEATPRNHGGWVAGAKGPSPERFSGGATFE